MWFTCRFWKTFSLLFVFSIPLLLSFFLLNISVFPLLSSFFLSFSSFHPLQQIFHKQSVVCTHWKLIWYHWACCFRISLESEEVLFYTATFPWRIALKCKFDLVVQRNLRPLELNWLNWKLHIVCEECAKVVLDKGKSGKCLLHNLRETWVSF